MKGSRSVSFNPCHLCCTYHVSARYVWDPSFNAIPRVSKDPLVNSGPMTLFYGPIQHSDVSCVMIVTLKSISPPHRNYFLIYFNTVHIPASLHRSILQFLPIKMYQMICIQCTSCAYSILLGQYFIAFQQAGETHLTEFEYLEKRQVSKGGCSFKKPNLCPAIIASQG